MKNTLTGREKIKGNNADFYVTLPGARSNNNG